VRADGKRGVLLSVIKNGNASTFLPTADGRCPVPTLFGHSAQRTKSGLLRTRSSEWDDTEKGTRVYPSAFAKRHNRLLQCVHAGVPKRFSRRVEIAKLPSQRRDTLAEAVCPSWRS